MGSRLAGNERRAAVEAVCEVFATAGVIDHELLFAADLDPARLRSALLARSPGIEARAGLGADGEAAFRRLLDTACVHVVEHVTSLPSFPARADAELVRRSGETRRSLADLSDRLGRSGEARDTAFEEQYARHVAQTQGRLELFGLTLGNAEREWSLSTAYISLGVSGVHWLEETSPHPMTTTVRAEQALASCERMLLRGPAGSGKSTLVQWLAVNAACRSFGSALADWNRYVPFVLRLRSLRDFLPLPAEFLSAMGNPLHGSAPDGWVEGLLGNGRALVLIDGVDEVPARLRQHTKNWLRSLIAAYPAARYVVTTRPSAVPEDWLGGQGFTAHSLQPMDREDIREFIAHWHRAAHEECDSEEKRTQLTGFEESLQQAVATRRELGRLATNPLMCALLCALNRDRRMHLPRARKELYDAALDMLLVRRDTERDIATVEGVDLTRDEQTLLLQRLAYWLIRNGQTEAACEDAIGMIDGWLDSMPQVKAQGDAGQVFRHLLIRSGLLREPVPGSVDFVHRTFQDYLGAKAAVEERDFGLLVGKAHDDQWDDVVRMAVGHARPEERARVLRQLLRRADRVKRHRQRLTLLAAACLEHAPELDPGIRGEIEGRTEKLLPPRSREDAEELAKAGELVLDLLQGPEELDEESAGATVRTAALVKGDIALGVISRFRKDTRFKVGLEISNSWGAFDTQDYVDAVLSDAMLERVHLTVRTTEQLRALSRLSHAKRISLDGDHDITAAIAACRELDTLYLYHNNKLNELSALADCPRLGILAINDCPFLIDLSPLTEVPLTHLFLYRPSERLSLRPLAELSTLKHLGIDFSPSRTVGEIPVDPQLTGLHFYGDARQISLDGIERLPSLLRLTLTGDPQGNQLAQHDGVPQLTNLQLHDQSALDPGTVVRHQKLRSLELGRCTLTSSLSPLTALPELIRLSMFTCDSASPIDLSPLAHLDRLTITVQGNTPVRGTHLFPPDRLHIQPSSE
ncbi:NACHT domain-containing protein [Streptomyces olivoreticuli]|uniref:NACHT domain-containing protein n=1 Tax=Streptomyces olivoreticuli TaxID=68246 RepID=UPI0026585F4E|nr:NACHT domain-containing protein [Streptomyces olivoreticuli]WKK22574.1 NACHT domain-containing protein [Streptomyces olivoreticuli]